MRKRKLFGFIGLGKKSARDLKADFYIFGLGNMGKKYAGTRHNVGFDVVDTIAHDFGVDFLSSACKGIYTKISHGDKTIMLIKPQTYMNNSGECVKAFMSKAKIDLDKIVVIYDDIDINKSAIRIKSGGSAGTHNGLRSIIYHLERDDFKRIRVGIGRPKNKQDLVEYVIGRYDKSEYEVMYDCYNNVAKAALEICENGINSAQAKYNFKGIK